MTTLARDTLALPVGDVTFSVEFAECGKPYGIIVLTPCCKASGKGMEYETGVGCRRCHREVDPIYGDIGNWPEYRIKVGVWWLGSTPESLVREALQMAGSTNVENEALHVFERINASAAHRQALYVEAHR